MGRSNKRKLAINDHRRDSTGMRYVYAVLSRRAQGVSVGINLNPNNACNWACNYCQVPDLVRGKGPRIELSKLRSELESLLEEIESGRFMAERVDEGSGCLKDIAFSGNGEPTTSPDFEAALTCVAEVLAHRKLLGTLPVTLITNGSMLNKNSVLQAVAQLATFRGRVWFKFDRATQGGSEEVNGQAIDLDRHLARLHACAARCETWIQSCFVADRNGPPDEAELTAYLAALDRLVVNKTRLAGVLLYSLARPSQQPGGGQLAALDKAWLEGLADRIREKKIPVDVHA